MSTLYFIRHTESEANQKRILASVLPYPLSRAGRKEADDISSELESLVAIHRIISSPLLRAVETASAFGKAYGIDIETDKRLSEQNLGSFSGMTYDEVKTDPNYVQNPLNRWNWIPEGGGESYAMVAERIISFLKSLEGRDIKENILIVTHAVAFRLIRSVLENLLPKYPSSFPNNGEIWKVIFKGVGEFHEIESIFLGKSRDFAHNP